LPGALNRAHGSKVDVVTGVVMLKVLGGVVTLVVVFAAVRLAGVSVILVGTVYGKVVLAATISAG